MKEEYWSFGGGFIIICKIIPLKIINTYTSINQYYLNFKRLREEKRKKMSAQAMPIIQTNTSESERRNLLIIAEH